MLSDVFSLAGRAALVTGGNSGIGLTLALALREAGAKVAIGGRRADRNAAALAKLGGDGPSAVAVELDVCDEGSVEGAIGVVVERFGRIDILVNNAGGSRPLPVDAPDSAWDEALTLNFTRYRQVTHALLPQMMTRKWGRIINITGKSEPEGLNAAFAAKAAVHAWAKGLSREIGEHGITVNCIPPGRIMSEQIRRNYPPDYRERFAGEEIPVGYWGEPEDLAALAVFLASAQARYMGRAERGLGPHGN